MWRASRILSINRLIFIISYLSWCFSWSNCSLYPLHVSIMSLLYTDNTWWRYRGLILQDLTFIHLGNPDEVADGVINFRKRWQQFTILDLLRKFKLTFVASRAYMTSLTRSTSVHTAFNAMMSWSMSLMDSELIYLKKRCGSCLFKSNLAFNVAHRLLYRLASRLWRHLILMLYRKKIKIRIQWRKIILLRFKDF